MRTPSAVALALSVATVALAQGSPPAAQAVCPPAIAAAVLKAFPGGKVTSCTPEKADGHDQFEVKFTRADGAAIEVDVSPAARVLQVEEKVALDKLPAAVARAFKARYGKGKLTAAEKQTVTDKGTFFEVGFTAEGKAREATFGEDGTFVSEE